MNVILFDSVMHTLYDAFEAEPNDIPVAALRALYDLEVLFKCTIDGRADNRLCHLLEVIEAGHVCVSQYNRAISILRRYKFTSFADRTVHHMAQCSASDRVFLYLASHKSVPTHKCEIIYGILGCSYSCESSLALMSDALYKQRDDEPRMQLILAILETQVE